MADNAPDRGGGPSFRGFVSRAGGLAVARVAGAAVIMVQGLVVARWLGPELHGAAGLIVAYPALIFALLNTSSADAGIKFFAEQGARDESTIPSLCRLLHAVELVVRLVALSLVIVSAGWAAVLLVKKSHVEGLLVLYAAAQLPDALMGPSRAILVTLGRFSMLAWVDFLNEALRAALVVTLVVSGNGLFGVILGNALASVVRGFSWAVAAHGPAKKAWGKSWIRAPFPRERAKRNQVLAFIWRTSLSVSLRAATKGLDLLTLGFFRNPVECGYYRLAKTLTNGLTHVIQPLQTVSFRILSRHWAATDKRGFQSALRSLAVWALIPAAAALPGIPLAPWIVQTLAGKAFFPAVLALQILLVGSVITLATFWFKPYFLTTNQTRFWLILSMIDSVIAVPSFLLGILLGGYNGLAVGQVFKTFFTSGVACVSLLRRRPFPR